MKAILVIENMINRKIANRLISSFVDEIIEVSSVNEVIDIVNKEKIDIIFMDIFMKGEDEISATKAIRKKFSKEQLAIYAMASDDKVRSRVFNGILKKPLQHTEVALLFKDLASQNDIFNVSEFEQFYTDKEIRKDILHTFLEEEVSDTKRMTEAYKTKDIEEIYQAVHYMKGTFSYLKANKIFNITKEICDLCKGNELEEVLELEEDLMNAYNELLKEVKNYI